jgi:RNA polymerase sigma-70 factor (ECF subfamily)
MSRHDEKAWTEFHTVYFSRLHRYALVLQNGNDAAAADCVQQTFLRVVRHVRVFEEELELWKWLCCLSRCCAIDEARARKRYSLLLEKFAHRRQRRNATGKTPESDLIRHLETCLLRWPDEDRSLIEEKYLESQSCAEIASSRGLSEKAVESRLGRLRIKLRKCILAEMKT